MEVAAAPSAEKRRSVHLILREFLEEVVESEDEIHLPQVIAQAHDRFENDEEFHQALLADAVGLLVAQALRSLVSHARHLVPTQDGAVKKDRIEIRAKEIAARMFESLGDGHRKSFLALNRSELDYVIGEREAMIAGLSRFNAFARDARKGLRTDAQTVGERYSDAEFERLWNRHFARDAGNDQLRLAPNPK